METEIQDYVRKLTKKAEKKVNDFFSKNSDFEKLVENHFLKNFDKDTKFRNFQEFYFEAKFKYNKSHACPNKLKFSHFNNI